MPSVAHVVSTRVTAPFHDRMTTLALKHWLMYDARERMVGPERRDPLLSMPCEREVTLTIKINAPLRAARTLSRPS